MRLDATIGIVLSAEYRFFELEKFSLSRHLEAYERVHPAATELSC